MHRASSIALYATVVLAGLTSLQAADKPLNVLIITVDDMNADSVGVFGCPLADTTPNIDRLATRGMRFEYAHVQVGNCMPSRNVLWSGLYPHNNGVEGFYQVRSARHPHLVDRMKQAGYFTAIAHKVNHSTPYTPYGWDLELDRTADGQRVDVKRAKSYGESVVRGIAAARAVDKPFCLVVNISDPHKPFYAEGRRGETMPDPNVPSRTFEPDEVPIPGFLFDDAIVRKELAHYYSSVRRADDCVGAILAALKDSRAEDRTLVVFLSDHGMPLPFAKTQLYHHSTRTPLIIVWPGVTQSGSIDDRHMVSAVDLLPTLLEIVGAEPLANSDGRSFASLLSGGTQEDRGYVVKEYNENAGASRDPMRAIQTQQFLYIFNPWSNGSRVMATATTGTSTYRRLAQLAGSDPQLAARHDLYRYREVEELYDVAKDPDCLHNLIDDPVYTGQLDALRTQLAASMRATGDPMLGVFLERNDAEVRESFVRAQEEVATARKKAKARPQGNRKRPLKKKAN